MVALDDGGVGTLAAFDDIGIDGTLGKIVQLAEGSGFFLKDFNKVTADDVPFFFRLRNALQIRKEAVGCVGTDEPYREEMTENMADLIALSLAQEAVIHEHAGETLSDGFIDQGGNNRRIHAAG